jgi:hypothetical protein
MHLAGTIAIDFLTVPTVTFNVRYVFFVLSLSVCPAGGVTGALAAARMSFSPAQPKWVDDSAVSGTLPTRKTAKARYVAFLRAAGRLDRLRAEHRHTRNLHGHRRQR